MNSTSNSNAIRSITYFDLLCSEINLNEYLLYFDKIIIDNVRFSEDKKFASTLLSRRKGSINYNTMLENYNRNLLLIEDYEKENLIEFTTCFTGHSSWGEDDFDKYYGDEQMAIWMEREMIFENLGATINEINRFTSDYVLLEFLKDSKIAATLNKKNTTDSFIPICNKDMNFGVSKHNTDKVPGVIKTETISIIVNKFPAIAMEKIQKDKLLELRENEYLKKKQIELRNWVSKIATASVSVSDIVQELDVLYNNFEDHYKLLKQKYTYTKFDIIVVPLISFVTLNWKDIPNKILEIKNAKNDFALSLLSIPGKEISYLHSLNQELNYFSN
jgi:hypothetical protein